MRVFFLVSSPRGLDPCRAALPGRRRAAGRVPPHRARRRRGDDAPRREPPLRDAVRRAGDGHGGLLHPRELLPHECADPRGRA